MFGKIGIVWVAVFLAVAAAAWGGILKVEVPADVEREDVLNPTAETEDRLDTLLREELARNPGAVEFAPVAFTKNGEIISPDVERDGTDAWSDNRLGFEPALKYYLTN
jgi:hypothetical protein